MSLRVIKKKGIQDILIHQKSSDLVTSLIVQHSGANDVDDTDETI